MKLRAFLYWLAITAQVLPFVQAIGSDQLQDVVQPVIRKHCLKCHDGAAEAESEVNLVALKTVADLTKDADLLGTLIKVLDTNAMPPADEPPLDA